MICLLCKRSMIGDDSQAVMVFAGKKYHYHSECANVIHQRLAKLWDMLTGPEEEFEAWLREED